MILSSNFLVWCVSHGVRVCRCFVDERGDAGDELQVALGLGVPTPGGGVVGEEGGVLTLGCQDGQVVGGGVE